MGEAGFSQGTHQSLEEHTVTASRIQDSDWSIAQVWEVMHDAICQKPRQRGRV